MEDILVEGWVKLNSDDFVLSFGKASCGGLIRDSFGGFIRYFEANLGSCPIIIIEF